MILVWSFCRGLKYFWPFVRIGSESDALFLVVL